VTIITLQLTFLLHIAVSMNEIIGYACAALIGISLGLIGGGGSILTVPVLVYLFHLSPLVATSYSLFIVGSTSLVGAVHQLRKGLVDVRTALLFGIASVLTVFITRKFIIPSIPDQVGEVGNFPISFSFLTMVLFALLMLLASFSMISRNTTLHQTAHKSRIGLLVYGMAIGAVTGFLGAGGGFLLIPALVLLLGLDMKKAVGTSLLIIAMNSLIGFLGDTGQYNIDWLLVGLTTLIAIGGSFIGSLLSKKIKGERLKKIFGWFVLAMAIYILVKEIFIR
jgi:uncharacterized membrane protein YfcA